MKGALILILAFLIFSCKKDSVDKYVFFPLPYFPVYPGSYWKYVDSNNDTTIYKTDDSYKEDFYTIQGSGYYSDTMLVPFYEGEAVWGYEIHSGYTGNAASSPLAEVVSESRAVGSHWVVIGTGGTQISKKITAKDTTISFNGKSYYPTIVVEEYYSQGPPTYIWLSKRYYTKDIGVVREDLNDSNDSIVTTKLLVDYHINK